METNRYDEEMRRRLIARRRRQMRRIRLVRRRRRIVLCMCSAVFLVVLITGLSVRGIKQHGIRKQQEAELKLGVEAVQACYENFLKERGGTSDIVASKGDTGGAAIEASADIGEKEEGSFASWFMKAYPKEKKVILRESKDGKLSADDIYAAVGETMHVVYDRYRGYLDDAGKAEEQGIYLKDGKAGEPAEVVIAGDLCFAEDGFVLDHYDTVNDLSECISPEVLKMSNDADIFYLNHEYCISDRGEPLEGKLYTFRAKPERMGLLEEMGTDLVSLANNHVYDYGEDAMMDTMDLLDEAKIPYVGGGRNSEEAERPIYFVVNGIKIGFVAATNAEIVYYTPKAEEDSPGVLEAYDTAEYNKVIQEAAGQCDYLIAYIHWGDEDTNDYADYQHDMGKEFLEVGADIVVGGHPHVLQGMEYMDGKPVIYSMGDFWFNDETKYTGLLKLDINTKGLDEMSFVPCLQTGYTTQYIEDKEEQAEFYEFFEELSPNLKIDSKGVFKEITR
ncbi:CapA family protein [Faecalicatena contorta]|uniref:Poly-gamma-glutamate synthesis protein (Capsule biosynthesis protein) n=1 Tax=Faecalicatena contorta TaxID=39482 RepID=A0A316AJ50_9FIRM|nr:CapA family protein [Faecalicatena contorta]PWJ49977.1 poly-gamma-glutamate synthesis protein (capsule biosynthesis protein) [Faecalicatena contorta]SUQ14098.1 poly-gamma-glutamate synthesis protein (capsule biosynthesis protein) [Faecalicatena contorta]